jgi:non-specific protein-tyrosine kinase
MTFDQFWATILKRWRLIVICLVLVGLGAFVGSKLMKPLYQSSVLVQVAISSGGNGQSDYSNLLASDELVQTESTLAASDQVINEVASHYPGLTATALAGEVSSSPKTNTQLFEIVVADPSPTRAAHLANDIAATLIKQRSQAIQQENEQAQQQIQQNINSTVQQINTTTAQISTLQGGRGHQGQITLLQAQLSGLQQHLNQWQTALAQLELTQAQGGDPLRVVQPAQPATSPVRPDIRLNTLGGLLAGMLVGILLALLYERFDTRLRTPADVANILELPVLANVWRVNSAHPAGLINPTGRDANVEAYRILRTNIGFSTLDKPLHSILLTSAVPSEGKSIIAANLAIFMAKAGKTTLLIDADLRRPIQHVLFSLPANSQGLSNAILASGMYAPTRMPPIAEANQVVKEYRQQENVTMNRLSLKPFIHSVGIPNLWVMPSGPLPPNPSELLDSKAMQRFFTTVENCGIDTVIFDSPPLLGISDACILASKVDGTIVVVDIARAKKGKTKQLKEVLSQTGANVLGLVVNKQRKSRRDTADTYYYYLADQQEDEHKNSKNGHTPAVPVASPQVSPQFHPRGRTN